MRLTLGLVFALTACGAPSAFAPNQVRDLAAPGSTSPRFLYVTDLYNDVVDIYTVPTLKFVRHLTGFFGPQGECTNAAGDVWIVDTGYQKIVEYAPGATKPMAVLTDTFGLPAGCAVNPVNGDLAVTDEYANSGPAEVLVFPNASQSPQSFRNGRAATYAFAAYDTRGNLFVSGETLKNVYVLTRLRLHGNQLNVVKVSGATLHDAGSVLWYGGKLVLGDQACHGGTTSCLYVASVAGNTATVSATVPLGSSCDVVQVALFGGDIYGGNEALCSHGKSSVNRWSYPKGQREATVSGVQQPIGAAISGPPTERL